MVSDVSSRIQQGSTQLFVVVDGQVCNHCHMWQCMYLYVAQATLMGKCCVQTMNVVNM